jgi:hypothetical protein
MAWPITLGDVRSRDPRTFRSELLLGASVGCCVRAVALLLALSAGCGEPFPAELEAIGEALASASDAATIGPRAPSFEVGAPGCRSELRLFRSRAARLAGASDPGRRRACRLARTRSAPLRRHRTSPDFCDRVPTSSNGSWPPSPDRSTLRRVHPLARHAESGGAGVLRRGDGVAHHVWRLANPEPQRQKPGRSVKRSAGAPFASARSDPSPRPLGSNRSHRA